MKYSVIKFYEICFIVFCKHYDEHLYTSQEDVIEFKERDDYIFNLDMRQHANDVLQYILPTVWSQ